MAAAVKNILRTPRLTNMYQKQMMNQMKEHKMKLEEFIAEVEGKAKPASRSPKKDLQKSGQDHTEVLSSQVSKATPATATASHVDGGHEALSK